MSARSVRIFSGHLQRQGKTLAPLGNIMGARCDRDRPQQYEPTRSTYARRPEAVEAVKAQRDYARTSSTEVPPPHSREVERADRRIHLFTLRCQARNLLRSIQALEEAEAL